jgi:hypothetical protein
MQPKKDPFFELNSTCPITPTDSAVMTLYQLEISALFTGFKLLKPSFCLSFEHGTNRVSSFTDQNNFKGSKLNKSVISFFRKLRRSFSYSVLRSTSGKVGVLGLLSAFAKRKAIISLGICDRLSVRPHGKA